jgi:acylphosphatase
MIARRLLVHGRVQGVGYREAMVEAARRAGVSGWVRNRREGQVEAWLEGEADAVDGVIEWARRGPMLARVAAVEIEVVAEEGFAEFTRAPTA